MRVKGIAALCAAMLMSFLAPAAKATTITLDQLLLPNATIQSGDKLFSNFTYSTTGAGMPTAANVNVATIGTGIGTNYFGIRISGGFKDSDPTSQSADALIGYTVTVTNPNYVITDAHMNSNIDATGGAVEGSITETFTAVVPSFPPVTPPQISNFNVHNGNFLLSATTVFGGPGYKQIDVLKDILMDWEDPNPSSPTTSSPKMSFVDQTFSQAQIAVPLPASAWASFGMLGLLGVVRMRRARN